MNISKKIITSTGWATLKRHKCRAPIALTLAALLPISVPANPQGMSVWGGSGSAVTHGNQLNVTVSQNAVLNWGSFNIAPGETTTFIQPNASSIVWNHINNQNPSQIFGNLNANGIVVLMNSAGFYFGPNSHVSAAGLIVSTASSTPIESSAGMFWDFNGTPPRASIINYGQLDIGPDGSAFLIANHIENHGTITAPLGNIGLMAGNDVQISERPDGLGLSANVRLPSGSVDNTGRLVADGGTIALNARVVNQNGLIQANTVNQHNGVIELVSSESVTLGNNSVVSANGGAGAGQGGSIVIKSDGTFADAASSRIDVSGGATGGNGGQVEISAPLMSSIQSVVDGHANNGSTGGQLVIDPLNITLGNSGSGSAGSGTVGANDPPAAGTLSLNVNSAFIGFSHISLQALNNITLSSGVNWDLAQSTGMSGPGCQLTLEAGNNITINNGSSIVGGSGWSMTLEAGRNFSSPGVVTAGLGNISLIGSAGLQTQDGSISLRAGNNVTLGTGYVRTVGGGNIDVTAVSGNVNSGTGQNGYDFLPTGYSVNANLSGISTAAGGNVSLTSGQDIISYLPVSGGVVTDAGSGAFGSAPGNVTLNAGRNVVGHYVEANGTGTITAGNNAGMSATLLALSLIAGGWTVNATHDILLQEVRNPNGTFNNRGLSSSTTRHYFDYSPDAYVSLTAGNTVQLAGTDLPRLPGTFEQNIPSIYAPSLQIHAGAGGVVLGNDVVLFPSPHGELNITTTAGGSLVGSRPGVLTQLIMSDSGQTQYRTAGNFGVSDHAAIPVQINNPNPVVLNIAGDLDNILVGVPKVAEITVGGNMVNSRFNGQNLHNGDVTSIHVAGDILNRNEFTSVIVGSAPNFSLLLNAYPPFTGTLASLPALFHYDPGTHSLTFQGRMSGEQLQALLNLQVAVLDQFGRPVLNPDGTVKTVPAEFISAALAQQLYVSSQDIPSNPNTGYVIGGGGRFDLTAHDLDLGATAGIISQGPRENAALANYFTHGADINVNLTGNLNMFSTAIESLNGGGIAIYADGTINVGSSFFQPDNSVARGIFTTDNHSDVSVIARSDININGSRIAAYDGGNVLVRSLTGNVDAGVGGRGSVTVEKIYVDPVTHQILTYAPTIPGSGILATTFPPSLSPGFPASRATVGNILVETPRGNITANAGGIVQIPLNGLGNNAGSVTLRAGTLNPDGTVEYLGNIEASGSGVIGSTVDMKASGSITGVIFARNTLNIDALQNVNVTAVGQGAVNVSAGGNVSGTIVGLGSVNASGASVDASLLSQNVTTSGNVSSAQVGFAQGTAANSTSQSLHEDGQTGAPKEDDESDEKKKIKSRPVISRTVSRVTVLLPKL